MFLENIDHIINKLIDTLKKAFHLKEDPDLLIAQSRKSIEAILREIYKREIGPVPPQITIKTMLDKFSQHKIIPHQIHLLFETVNRFGNMTLHPDDELSSRTSQEAQIVESNLAGICNWFFNNYLQLELEETFFTSPINATSKTALSNYNDLLRAALTDFILDLDEYENILQARIDLGISEADALITEQGVCWEILNKKVNGIIDVMSNSDLNSFKKHDRIRENRPDWVLRSIHQTQELENKIFRKYLRFYFDEFSYEAGLEMEAMFSILGCWQGWYFQFEAKTYYDLMFLAKSEDEFIGLSIEPINPTWNEKGYEDTYLLAWIEGALLDEILFSYKKTMILEDTWSVDYEGVIIEDGHLFEGEWRINRQNGSFNAMRSKALLPIRIFDTTRQQPIVPATYLNRLQDLTSSWLVQITGKTSIIGVLHIIEIRQQLFANLVIPLDEGLALSYCEGKYDETARATIREVNTIKGNHINFKITFNVDWNEQTLNGTIKDDVHRMRSFKGFKL
ncbi:MAG: hypothetical protein ACK5F0_11470 [Flavobacteriales bacterium]|jgi:hypothetical protein